MRPTVVLFDVDGTLVHTGGAGRRALAGAFDRVCGRPDALDRVQLGGMTDRLILRAALAAIGRELSEELADRVLETYLKLLPEEVARSEGYRVLPGARAAVEALSGRSGLALGLGTGNVRRGAEVKLARGELHRAFPFGGFGCDHEDRAELLRAGAIRGAEVLGVPLEACRVVIVGDTPRDARAARAIGAECVCVATGSFAAEDLRAEEPTAVLETMESPEAIDLILG